MRIVVFGLTISSSWGNGHATFWRGLCRALTERGHVVTFFERDVPYYAVHRDLVEPDGCRLRLYREWADVCNEAAQAVRSANLTVLTSYCPDTQPAADLMLSQADGVRAFYDLDTGVTLGRLNAGSEVAYLPHQPLGDFDLVLSYTGGRALEMLQRSLGARRVAPLYGCVDPDAHRRIPVDGDIADLSYLGTYAADRQDRLQALFVEPARRRPSARFVIGGSLYPRDFPWTANMYYLRHAPPAAHPAFYSASRLTLNVTREAMAEWGWCPPGRLFEAAACSTAVMTDAWEGLEHFFEPGREVIVARTTDEALDALALPAAALTRIGAAARRRRWRNTPLPAARANWNASSRNAERGIIMWGIVPAAGHGSRIQPLAFSKELLPVGSRRDGDHDRPRAVSEYLVERLVLGGATRLCFVIGPGKCDIVEYYGGCTLGADVFYAVQSKPAGLCDAIFRAAPLVDEDDWVLVRLPDTIWFPPDGLSSLGDDPLSFLVFPVDAPQYFDAVISDATGVVECIQVKDAQARSHWVWGAFKLSGRALHDLHALWREAGRGDEYIGTLVNAYLKRGGRATAVRAGTSYVDVGTINGYRRAVQLLSESAYPSQEVTPTSSVARVLDRTIARS